MTAPEIKMHQSTPVPLGRLTLAGYNPRDMPESELLKLERSIVEFGFIDPVVARREDGLLIGGHQRVTALRRLLEGQGKPAIEIEEYLIPVIFLDGVSDDRAKLLNVALNKIHGEWDFAKLSDLFASLDGMDPGLLSLTGFDPKEINDVCKLMQLEESDKNPVSDSDDPDEQIARQARKFAFEVQTDAEAATCRAVLAAFGMTGPGNAGLAFLAVMQAAKALVEAPGFKPPETPKKRASKAKTATVAPIEKSGS